MTTLRDAESDRIALPASVAGATWPSDAHIRVMDVLSTHSPVALAAHGYR